MNNWAFSHMTSGDSFSRSRESVRQSPTTPRPWSQKQCTSRGCPEAMRILLRVIGRQGNEAGSAATPCCPHRFLHKLVKSNIKKALRTEEDVQTWQCAEYMTRAMWTYEVNRNKWEPNYTFAASFTCLLLGRTPHPRYRSAQDTPRLGTMHQSLRHRRR